MDKQRKNKTRLAPLRVTFEEFKEHPEKLDYTTGILKKTFSPSVAFPPISCDKSGLITSRSNTDFVNEEKSVVKGEKTPQLPQIIPIPDSDSEEETETFYDFSNHTDWIKTEDNGWPESEENSHSVKSPEVYKKEVASLRESVKRELDKAIGIVLQARLPFLVKRVAKRDKSQRECDGREKGVESFCVRRNAAAASVEEAKCCNKSEQNKSSFGRKCSAHKDSISITAVFSNRKKTQSDKQKEKQKNYELNSEKDEYSTTQVLTGNESCAENIEGYFKKNGKKRNKTKPRKEKSKIVVFDDEMTSSALKTELEHFALAKKRFDLMKQREQNFLIWDEKRKFEIAPRTSSSFSFSYFPPLQQKCAECKERDEIEDQSDVCSLSLPAPNVRSPRAPSLTRKETMNEYGSHHELTSTNDMA